MLDDTVILSRHPEAADSRVGDETVILHLGSGTYFGLDPVGSRIWELLDTPLSVAVLFEGLISEFDVSPDELAKDMDQFLAQMLENGILVAGEVTGGVTAA